MESLFHSVLITFVIPLNPAGFPLSCRYYQHPDLDPVEDSFPVILLVSDLIHWLEFHQILLDSEFRIRHVLFFKQYMHLYALEQLLKQTFTGFVEVNILLL